MNWPINVIISCETGKLLGEVEQMYQFLDWMTGYKLFTHQLPRAAATCRPFLEEQFSWLKDCRGDEITPDKWAEYMGSQIALHGATVEVNPLPEGVWMKKDPMVELVEMQQKQAIESLKAGE